MHQRQHPLLLNNGISSRQRNPVRPPVLSRSKDQPTEWRQRGELLRPLPPQRNGLVTLALDAVSPPRAVPRPHCRHLTSEGSRHRKKDALRQRVGTGSNNSQSRNRGSPAAPRPAVIGILALLSPDEAERASRAGPARNAGARSIALASHRRTLFTTVSVAPPSSRMSTTRRRCQAEGDGKSVEAAARVSTDAGHRKVVARRTVGLLSDTNSRTYHGRSSSPNSIGSASGGSACNSRRRFSSARERRAPRRLRR